MHIPASPPELLASEPQIQSFCSDRKKGGKVHWVKATFLQTDGGGLLAEVDLGVYTLSALLRVAYRFTDRCYLHLQNKNERLVEVRFRPKAAEPPLDEIAGEFCNELLDQSLREIVARESEPVRNLILAHALSRTPFVDPELETTDPFTDPTSNPEPFQ